MTRKIAICSALLSVFVLFATLGCDKNAATAPNFEDGLNHYFQANPECMSTYTFPTKTDLYDSVLEAFVSAGLVAKTDAPPIAWGHKVLIYSLTPSGHAAASPKNPSAICYGTKRVGKILNFTEPVQGIQGVNESTVTYTWTLTNIPAWADNLIVDKRFLDTKYARELKGEAPEGNHKGETVMVLTNLGWRVEGDE